MRHIRHQYNTYITKENKEVAFLVVLNLVAGLAVIGHLLFGN